ncbi:MAG: sulfur carrier protein ThiS [Deltaproteobacteria bacterium]|nr:sulfur carrier protein ThiS [Deltaproteobacteria bacterium]MCB9786069.1 sulfur carrier protein ThiS [Deltaproteobacteria bacterium]
MELTVNGESRRFDEDALSVAGLIERLGLGGRRVAVEVNEAIVRRAEYGERMVCGGDRVEIVHFVGGGA